MSRKAVCLISGGIDSCVSAFLAYKQGYKIYGLSFNYGQRHDREIKSAKDIAKIIRAVKHIIFNIDLRSFRGSSLVDKDSILPKDQDLNHIGKSVPSTYVPARNTIFLSVGLAYAEVLSAEAIFIGVTATDYSGYPDCRPEYIKAYQAMADLATKKCKDNSSIKIIAPLINMSKGEIIKKGLELDVPFDKTWSCYSGDKNACGHCDSCLLRLKGFKEAGSLDPIKYDYIPKWYG
jgi:7-cyano-7-deazaguanine synthase